MERLVNSREFIESISGTWSKHFGRQAKGFAEQAGEYSETGDFGLAEKCLNAAKDANERGIGVLRFWGKVADMLKDEGLTEIPVDEVVDSLRNAFAPAAEILPFQSATTIVIPPHLPIPPAEPVADLVKKEPISRRDLAPVQLKIAYATFAIDRKKQNFQNPEIDDVVRTVYSLDQIEDPKLKETTRRTGGIYFHHSREPVLKKLYQAIDALDFSSENILPNTRQFLDWLLGQPEYANIPRDRLAKTLREIWEGSINYQQFKKRGSIPIKPESKAVQPAKEEVREAEYPIFDRTDIGLLTEILGDTPVSQLVLLKIDLTDEDWGDMSVMTDGIETSFASEEEKKERKKLLKEKLLSFLRNKEGVYLANADDATTQRLLDHLQNVDSEEAIEQLFSEKKTEDQPKPSNPDLIPPRFKKLTPEEIMSLQVRRS